jgi:hypothetical protein
VTQSGYQALYGGVNAPFGVEDAFQEPISAESGLSNRQAQAALARQLRSERSDFLMSCSPFLAVFWAGNLALVGVIGFMQVDRQRLRMFLGVCAVLLLMLLLQLLLGTPLERRVSYAVAQAVRESPKDAFLFIATFSAGKTGWFWATFVAVLLAASTEVVAWVLGRVRFQQAPVTLPVTIGLLFGAVSVIVVLLQFDLWEAGLTAVEEKVAQLHRAEEAKAAKEEAERRRAHEAVELQTRQQRTETERRQAEIDQRRQAMELQERQQRIEAERREQEWRDEVHRREVAEREEARRAAVGRERERQEMERAASQQAEARRREARELYLKRRPAYLVAMRLAGRPSLSTRKTAAEYLTEILLHEEDNDVKRQAALALARTGSAGLSQLQTLEKLPRGQNEPLQADIAHAVEVIRFAGGVSSHVATYERLVSKHTGLSLSQAESPLARQVAVNTALRICADKRRALEAIYEAMVDSRVAGDCWEAVQCLLDAAGRCQVSYDKATRQTACGHLVSLVKMNKVPAEVVVRGLMKIVAEPGGLQAIEALGDLGRDAEAAAPMLKPLQNDPDIGIREAAMKALSKIGVP